MLSKALEKSINNSMAGNIIACTLSIILIIVSICPEVELLVLNPFWFVCNIESTSGLILLNIYIYIYIPIGKYTYI